MTWHGNKYKHSMSARGVKSKEINELQKHRQTIGNAQYGTPKYLECKILDMLEKDLMLFDSLQYTLNETNSEDKRKINHLVARRNTVQSRIELLNQVLANIREHNHVCSLVGRISDILDESGLDVETNNKLMPILEKRLKEIGY